MNTQKPCGSSKLRFLFAAVMTAAAVVLGAGCASTPERRIQQNPEMFEALPAEAQETVKSGRVELGYTPEAVFLALGPPDRKVIRSTRDEVREIWYYQGRFLTTETIRVHDQFGRFRPVRPALYLDRTVEHVYTRGRLEFVGGELVSIEETEQ